MNIANLQKYRVLFDFSVNALCGELTMNHAWSHLEIAMFIRLTKWYELMILS